MCVFKIWSSILFIPYSVIRFQSQKYGIQNDIFVCGDIRFISFNIASMWYVLDFPSQLVNICLKHAITCMKKKCQHQCWWKFVEDSIGFYSFESNYTVQYATDNKWRKCSPSNIVWIQNLLQFHRKCFNQQKLRSVVCSINL